MDVKKRNLISPKKNSKINLFEQTNITKTSASSP